MAIAFVGSWTSGQFNNSTGGTLAGRTSTAGNFVAITAESTDLSTFSISHSQAGSVQTARTDTFIAAATMVIDYVENIVGGASHTITLTQAAGTFGALNASEYSGVATSSSLDKTNVGTGTGTSLLSAATTTTAQADELLIGGGSTNNGTNSTWSAGASYNLRGNNNTGASGDVNFLEDRIVAATGTYTSSATWSGASGSWICQIATFKGAAAATLTYPPSTFARQRRAIPRTRARRIQPVPPQINPPIPLQSIHPTRQLRGMPVRRGHRIQPVPPQVNPPILPPRPTQHRTWATLLRRGRRVTPVPPQQNPIIAPPVANQARRLRGWPVRRGRSVSPVPVQQTLPTNPPYVTVGIQHRLWAGWLRRGRRATPIPPQQNPPLPPPHPTQHRTIPALLRRGRRTGPVGYQDTPQPAQGQRAPRLWRQKPRQPQTVPPPTVVLPNPVLPTKTATIRRLAGWLLRRGRKAEQGWPQGVNLVIPDITYPTAFEVLADWHLDFDADPSGLGVELTSGNLSFAADASGDTFTVDPSSQPFDLN